MLPFDTTCIGQASSHPHLRKPVLQQAVIERCQKIGLLARSKAHTNSFDVDSLQEDDLWLYLMAVVLAIQMHSSGAV